MLGNMNVYIVLCSLDCKEVFDFKFVYLFVLICVFVALIEIGGSSMMYNDYLYCPGITGLEG